MDVERTPPVADTGFVVALLNQADSAHESVTITYVQQQRSILLPQTVLAEVAYLTGREAGIAALIAFLRGLATSRFRLVALLEDDTLRVADILEQYADSRIDFVDASVMAVAERFSSTRILTLDQRDFRIFRPRHCQYFELLP